MKVSKPAHTCNILAGSFGFHNIPVMEQVFQGKQLLQPQLMSHYSTQSLFDIKSRETLDGLQLASCNPNDVLEMETQTETREHSESFQSEIETKLVISETKFCNACQTEFTDREEQLVHYKSDWHRYNLHLRLRGASFLTEDQFETISGDVSSISGSDDEDEEEENIIEGVKPLPDVTIASDDDTSSARQRNSQKVFFRNAKGELISVYRCLLHHKKNTIYEKDKLVAESTGLPEKTKWAVLMVNSGHFAGAIFDKGAVLEHKTFHRYTIRKKRGTSQSAHDGKGSHPKSAGANLRRYNERALVQDVQELMSKWKEHLDSCHFLFVRVPLANRGIFFAGKNAPFQKDDKRIRVVPFPTRRPTFSELKRVQQMLASVECYGPEAAVGATLPRSPRRFYNTESGQLEVRDPVLSPRPHSSKTKSKPSSPVVKAKKNPDVVERQTDIVTEDPVEEEEMVDMDLVETIEEIDFSHLKEFESTPKRKRNKKKETQSKIVDFCIDEREIRWKNSLFTACKTGNEKIFRTIIDEMTTHHKENSKPESPRENESSPTGSGQQAPSQKNRNSTEECNSSPSQQPPAVKNLPHSTNTTEEADAFHLDRPQTAATASEKEVVPVTSTPSSTASGESLVPDLLAAQQISEFLNRPLGDGGQTLLHVASRENHAPLVLLLLTHGADPALKDKAAKLPYNLGGSDVHNTFRRFMSNWPDRYDYAAAQIPSPLTEEMEAERRQKAAEKRKAKRKAANERNKEKKAAEALAREETQEKERYLALSDREKRALAAERRILQQRNTEGSTAPVLSRCYQCAADITGKVPFEYSDFKFCTTKCLREHRSKK